MAIAKHLPALHVVLQHSGIAMMKLPAKEQLGTGAKALAAEAAGALRAHAQLAHQLQSGIVMMKQLAKEQEEAGVHINRQEAHTQAEAAAIVLIPARLILVQNPNHGIAKMRALAKPQEQAGAPALEDMDIVQALAQFVIKAICGTAIQRTHARGWRETGAAAGELILTALQAPAQLAALQQNIIATMKWSAKEQPETGV